MTASKVPASTSHQAERRTRRPRPSSSTPPSPTSTTYPRRSHECVLNADPAAESSCSTAVTLARSRSSGPRWGVDNLWPVVGAGVGAERRPVAELAVDAVPHLTDAFLGECL